MKYNFDEIIDRRDTNSLKYDFANSHGKPEDVIPLWVADMDFRTPPEVTVALVKSSQHSIFGYSETNQEYFYTLKKWYAENFEWQIQSTWLVKTPGIVFAIAMAIRAFTNKGDGVMIQTPVYYPFSETILANERLLVNNSLVYENGAYHIDFDDLEAKVIANNVRLFILCNPHNPVGRVWTREELICLGDICVKYGVIVVSDEIHADFVYEGYKHLIFASLKPEYLNITITCTAPSKTFNLAGLQVSNIFIKNMDIKKKLKTEIEKSGYSQLGTMGLVACQAAYQHGKEWLDQLKSYLAGNLSLVRSFLLERLPQIKMVEPQGTYLVWLDFKDVKLTEVELDNLIVNEARLWLDRGVMFGDGGEGFQRINIACPRKTLEKALLQLEKAMNNYSVTKLS
ncbi:MAG TPA: MalY/PatB family protein [Ruminiclostridium sp.]